MREEWLTWKKKREQILIDVEEGSSFLESENKFEFH